MTLPRFALCASRGKKSFIIIIIIIIIVVIIFYLSIDNCKQLATKRKQAAKNPKIIRAGCLYNNYDIIIIIINKVWEMCIIQDTKDTKHKNKSN